MAGYEYNSDDSIKALHCGDLYSEYAYNTDQNLTGLKTMLGNELLADNHYHYDGNDNRIEKHQLHGTTTYTYDAGNRFSVVEYPGRKLDRGGNKMNIEQAFIKSVENRRVVEIVNERLNGSLKDIRLCNQMDVPDSYDEILANDVKRKVAISSSMNGWIAIIESKEVNDYAMLIQLSKELQTEVLAVIQSDVTGAWGYVEMFDGKVVKSYYNEEDDEIEDLLDNKLNEKEICIPLYMFREVVRERGNGWDIVQVCK